MHRNVSQMSLKQEAFVHLLERAHDLIADPGNRARGGDHLTRKNGGFRAMKSRWIFLPMLALSLFCFAPSKASAVAAASPAAAQYDHDHDWDQPPGEFRDAQRKGFHDGIEGARKDFQNHRPPNVENRDEYRHPSVSHDLRGDYRDGFRAGYERAMSHLNSPHY
jgi:hypothetical protein